MLGNERHFQDRSSYSLVTLDQPLIRQIVEASPEEPYLGLCLDIDPGQVSGLLMEMNVVEDGGWKKAKGAAARSLSVSRSEKSLGDAVLRLVRLLETPNNIPVLAPLALREIHYRLLTGE